MDQYFMCKFEKHATVKSIIKKILPTTERELLAEQIRKIRKTRDVYSKSSKEALELMEKTKKTNPKSPALDKMRSASNEYKKKSEEQVAQAKELLSKSAGLRR